MSAPRASKRRKVDDEHASSPGQAKSRGTPITYGKRNAKSSPGVARSAQKEPVAKSGSQIYFEAKAKLWRRKKKEEPVDVYDDIEGANRTAPRTKQRIASASKQNGTASTGRRSFGFSKQSHEPKSASTTSGPTKSTPRPQRSAAKAKTYEDDDSSLAELDQASGSDSESDAEQDDVEKEVLESSEQDVEEELEDDEDDPMDLEPPVAASGKRPAKMNKGWVAATEKPKTFEDEIRELQEKARKEVEEEGSEDELGAQGEAGTPSKKKSSQRKTSARSRREQRTAETSAPSPLKPLDRRKGTARKLIDDYEVPESDVDNRMDVDESDDQEMTTEPVRSAPPKVASTPRKSRGALSKANATTDEGPLFSPSHIQGIQRIVLEKATGKRPVALVNLDDEYSKVSTLIEQTITAGESNSMILIGARGSGKTALINQILCEQGLRHGTDFHAIRLNGFVHTDDKIALREIWRQLGKEMELDEEESISKNYADTMTRLLALLSHPAEMGLETDQVTKSVIFVLDEFELFAGHPRQTLLYNLFDIAQSRKAPIAVLGLTTRIDVAESLEKRVKSRFSHRYVHLGLAKSLQSFQQICRAPVAITADDLSSEEKVMFELSNDVTNKMAKLTNGSQPVSEGPIAAWNAALDKVFASEACASYLRRLYYTTKSAPEMFAALALAVATMPSDSPTTKTILEHFNIALSTSPLQAPDSKLTLLSSLSTLQLALLICAARLTNIYNTEIISFALTYEEYRVLASKARLQASASGAISTIKVWGKEVAKGAWDELIEVGLIMEDGRTGGTGRVDVGLEEIGMTDVDLGGWGKWCKEI